VTTLAFVVPTFRRFDLTRVCLTQLRWTCDELERRYGIKSTAVVVGDDSSLDVAQLLGFATVTQDNAQLGRKWNDGIEYAGKYLGVEYIVPFGTDNWIDPALIGLYLPDDGELTVHRIFTMVHQSGDRLATCRVSYDGGDGIRTMPSALLEVLDFRPCDEDRQRATDTSMRDRLGRRLGKKPPYHYCDLHPFQIVSFQSDEQQLNVYDDLYTAFGTWESPDPWMWLATAYDEASIDAVRQVYDGRLVAA